MIYQNQGTGNGRFVTHLRKKIMARNHYLREKPKVIEVLPALDRAVNI